MKKWLISLIEVDEDKLSQYLPRAREFSTLPNRLAEAADKIAPGALELDAVYLLTPAQKEKVTTALEKHALPYHEYAVETRGEHCDAGCPEHQSSCVIIRLRP